MTNQELERQLRDWYAVEIGANEPAPPSLHQRLAVVLETASLGAPPPLYRRMSLLAAAALLAAVAAGLVAVGSGIVKLPDLRPAVVSPSEEPSPSSSTPLPSPTPAPSTIASDGPAPWIVFGVDGASSGPEEPTSDPQLWAMRSDGSDAHEIAEGGPVAWSDDGTRLLVVNGSILIAEVGEDIGPFVDTGVEVPTNEQWEAFDFAPDGERVVFMRKSKCASRSGSSTVVLARYVAETAGENCHVLSILDLRTRELTDLDETLAKNQTDDPDPGLLELPAWSPDGSKIAYTRTDYVERTAGRRELWVVNAAGTDASRVDLAADVSVEEPRWSPDGTRISFTSVTGLSEGVTESVVYVADLATGRLDRITIGSDQAFGEVCCAEWLDNIHLRVTSRAWPDAHRFWLVALDTIPLESQVFVDLTEWLASSGAPAVSSYSAPGEPGRTFFWQPTQEGQP